MIFIFSNNVFSQSFSSTYTRSYFEQPSFVGIHPGSSIGNVNLPSFFDSDGVFDRSFCEAGQDFFLYISPLGCSPSVVRSDLLEKRDVPVFCPIIATKLNPLINVEAIDYLSFRGEIPREVSGVGYYPNKAALGGMNIEGQNLLGTKVGYATIILRRQPNESAMPDFIEGNLSATIRYDIKNAFGIGQSTFYLPVLSDGGWEQNFRKFGFWQGRGYLRAVSVQDNSATISVYSDFDSHNLLSSSKRVISSLSLDVGKRSNLIFMPGFNYCMGGLRLELKGVENPDSVARLNINGDFYELKRGERFIDEKCFVARIEKRGIYESVTIQCRTDQASENFVLVSNPKISLEIDGEVGDYSVGDKIFQDNSSQFFLAYLTTKGETTKQEDLIFSVFKTDKKIGRENLTESELRDFENYFKGLSENKKSYSIPSKIMDDFLIVSSEGIKNLSGEKIQDSSINSLKIIGFSGPMNLDFGSEEIKESYISAKQDYESVFSDFSQEKYPENSLYTLGNEALSRLIDLSFDFNQKKDTLDFCKEFQDLYPFSLPEKCSDISKLSSKEISFNSVLIDNRIYIISFDRIKEPTFEQFGAKISIRDSSDVKEISLRKNEIRIINESTNEYIKLVDVEKNDRGEESAIISLRIGVIDSQGNIVYREIERKIEKGRIEGYESNYLFDLIGVNLEKVAKVSVVPDIRYGSSESKFSFKIGIEKRAIQLTPDQTRDRIESLNKTLNTLEKINENLEKVVRAGKTACFLTGSALTIKNFFSNLDGSGIARQIVMRGSKGSSGWVDFCEEQKRLGEYVSIESCLLENSDKIDSSVNEVSNLIKTQNSEIKEIQSGLKIGSGILSEEVVNTKELVAKFVDEDYKNEILKNLGSGSLDIGNQEISFSDSVGNISHDALKISDARDLQLYSRLLNSDDDILRKISRERTNALLSDIYINSVPYVLLSEDESNLPQDILQSKVSFLSSGTQKILPYDGTLINNPFGNISQGTPIHRIYYNNVGYILGLQKIGENYRIENVYSIKGEKLDDNDLIVKKIKQEHVFSKVSYKNPCSNCKIRYYETGNYRGVPAIVPFDIGDGWYAAIRPVVPVSGAIKPVDDSGRVNSYWLCNVGTNNREEFFELMNSNQVDDVCIMFNRQTGQPYNQFPGLDERTATELINRARIAIEQAMMGYGKGSDISIFSKSIPVGEPATEIFDLECYDLMSPSDCNLLFNVCDPFICPTSRCNLGGTYYVRDVIGSGIAGSIFLCLPNFPEVKIPICVSGVHAGVDSYLSVLRNYRDCLEINLETGQTVGVCDYLHSVYVCDFFWRQALPVIKYATPNIFGRLMGQGVSGGGEYLSVKDSLDRAESSINYFTQYYAANSFQAFKARSIEGVGTEFCRNWLSIPGLRDGSFFDALTTPDSPPQFFGIFEEIPHTTVTVPPISNYKVMYHIYAGNDFPAYYSVYLKGEVGSFYQDISSRKIVGGGVISPGQSISETINILEPSGYKELCIVVNNIEECGFKQTSTDFGVKFIADSYIADQVKNNQITKSTECVSGTPSVLPLMNPNIQAGVEEGMNPSIYNRGIVRVCSTENPGLTTDSRINTKDARWQEVGYCDVQSIRCWLDMNSVNNAIDITNIREEAIQEVSSNYIAQLTREMGFVEDFEKLIEEIGSKEDSEKINFINKNLNRVFYNNQKAYLVLLRGDVFRTFAMNLFKGINSEEIKVSHIDVDDFQEKEKEILEKDDDGPEEKIQEISPENNQVDIVREGPVLPEPINKHKISFGSASMQRLSSYESIINFAKEDYFLSSDMIKAIILEASDANKDFVSDGKKGLMQLEEKIFRDEILNYFPKGRNHNIYVDKFDSDLFQPNVNIFSGSLYLRLLLDKYSQQTWDGNLNIVYLVYFWGQENVDKNCSDSEWKNCENIPREILQSISNVNYYSNELGKIISESYSDPSQDISENELNWFQRRWNEIVDSWNTAKEAVTRPYRDD